MQRLLLVGAFVLLVLLVPAAGAQAYSYHAAGRYVAGSGFIDACEQSSTQGVTGQCVGIGGSVWGHGFSVWFRDAAYPSVCFYDQSFRLIECVHEACPIIIPFQPECEVRGQIPTGAAYVGLTSLYGTLVDWLMLGYPLPTAGA